MATEPEAIDPPKAVLAFKSFPPDVATFAPAGMEMQKIAARIVVNDQASDTQAQELIKAVTEKVRSIKAILDPFCDNAHKLHKGLTAMRAAAIAPYESARALLTDRAYQYQEAEKRRAEAEETRRAEEARQRQEEERERALEAQRTAELDAILLEDEAPDVAEAIRESAAAAVIEADNPVEVVPFIETRTASVSGVTIPVRYSAENEDLFALALWCMGLPPDTPKPAVWEDRGAFLAAVGPELNRRATRDKEAFKVPGCKLVKTANARVSK